MPLQTGYSMHTTACLICISLQLPAEGRAVKLRGQCTNPRTQGSRDPHTSMPLRKQKQPSTAASGMAQHLTGRSKANISTKRPPRNMLDSGYKYTVVAPSSSSVACQDSTQQGKLDGPTQCKPNWGAQMRGKSSYVKKPNT